jgi:zinc protease
VIAVPHAATPLATIQVTVRNGAFTQKTADDAGIPHLLEHMLFKVYGSSGFAAEANKLDASFNGTTSEETVTYYITLPAENLARGMQLMANLVRSPRFDQQSLVAEQAVVRGELERAAANPDFLLRTAVMQRLWGAGWPRKNTIGNALSIHGASTATLKQVYDRFYVPNNAAVVVTGAIDAPEVFAQAARHFTRWRPGADPFAGLELPPLPPLALHQALGVTVESNDVTLLVAWQGPSVRDHTRATYAADLFTSVFNDRISGMHERLIDTGLFQSVSMSYATLAHTGPVTLRATTTADLLVEAAAALREELSLLSQPGYITQEAMQLAKKQQEVDWAMQMDMPSGVAWFVGDLWSVTGGVDYIRGYLDEIRSLEQHDLEHFIATWLADRPRVTGIMVSAETRRALGNRLDTTLARWRR